MSEGEPRVEHGDGVQTAHDSRALASQRSLVRRPSGASLARDWGRRGVRWALHQVEHRLGFSKISWEEEIIHDLRGLVERREDRALIERAFLESVGRLTAARSVRWIDEPAKAAGDQNGVARLEIVFPTGSATRSRTLQLRLSNPAKPWSPETQKRLKTLCSLAASSLMQNNLEYAREPLSTHARTRTPRAL